MAYHCECCNYSTIYKTHYEKHEKTKKHEKNKNLFVIPKFICKYCAQEYKHKQSLSKHIKYSCTKNKDEDEDSFQTESEEELKDEPKDKSEKKD